MAQSWYKPAPAHSCLYFPQSAWWSCRAETIIFSSWHPQPLAQGHTYILDSTIHSLEALSGIKSSMSERSPNSRLPEGPPTIHAFIHSTNIYCTGNGAGPLGRSDEQDNRGFCSGEVENLLKMERTGSTKWCHWYPVAWHTWVGGKYAWEKHRLKVEGIIWKETSRIICSGGFPGDPVVKTPCFQGRGRRFDPWLDN